MTNLRVWMAMAALMLCTSPSLAVTNIFSTQFEAAEGYNVKLALIGQNGWMADNTNGNGLVTGYLPGQAAYVGYFPLVPPADSLSVWHPLNYAPVNGLSLIHFSVLLAILDSTNNAWDTFYWSVYNSAGHPFVSLAFDNYYRDVSYLLDDNNGFVLTGVTFTNAGPYSLAVDLDLEHNTWSATLSGALLASNQPLTTVGATLDLGDIDAVWAIYDTNAPGNNFMVFDNYQVTANAAAQPAATLQSLGRTGNGPFLLRLTGPSGLRYAVEAATNLFQWTPLKTNTITDGSFDFIDTTAPAFSKRFYRGRLVP